MAVLHDKGKVSMAGAWLQLLSALTDLACKLRLPCRQQDLLQLTSLTSGDGENLDDNEKAAEIAGVGLAVGRSGCEGVTVECWARVMPEHARLNPTCIFLKVRGDAWHGCMHT